MEACRRWFACVCRTAFPRLPLRAVGKGRTAFLLRSIFAAYNFALDKEQIQPWRMQIDDVHLPESYVRDRKVHGTKTVPWLAGEAFIEFEIRA